MEVHGRNVPANLRDWRHLLAIIFAARPKKVLHCKTGLEESQKMWSLQGSMVALTTKPMAKEVSTGGGFPPAGSQLTDPPAPAAAGTAHPGSRRAGTCPCRLQPGQSGCSRGPVAQGKLAGLEPLLSERTTHKRLVGAATMQGRAQRSLPANRQLCHAVPGAHQRQTAGAQDRRPAQTPSPRGRRRWSAADAACVPAQSTACTAAGGQTMGAGSTAKHMPASVHRLNVLTSAKNVSSKAAVG